MRSKLIQCDKCNSFYDPSKHTKCPYCPVPGLSPGGSAVDPTRGVNLPGSKPAGEPRTAGGAGMKRPPPSEGVTVGIVPKKLGIDPIVGWLVCIDGKERGRDYRIYSDKNTVGRSETMRICIKGDDTIAREKHSVINFDSRHTRFYILPGDGAGNTYVNDTFVLEAKELNPWDVIEMGETKLVFVPLCGERFRWDESTPEPEKPSQDSGTTGPDPGCSVPLASRQNHAGGLG